MHAVRSVTCLPKVLAVWLRYANDCIRPAECPIHPPAHPVAVIDVRMNEGLGPREGCKDHACYRVARPVSGMQDLDPVVPDVCGKPQQTCCCGRQAPGEADKFLKFRFSHRDGPKLVGRSAIPGIARNSSKAGAGDPGCPAACSSNWSCGKLRKSRKWIHVSAPARSAELMKRTRVGLSGMGA